MRERERDARWASGPAVLALCVLAAGALVRAAVEVEPNESLDTAFAERVSLAHRFEVTATELGRAPLDLPAIGTPGAPAEIAEAPAPAGTAVRRDNWTYTVTVLEREADTVKSGRFEVHLLWNSREVGVVHVQQNVSNPLLREGARVTFDLGATRPEAPLFLVRVHVIVPEGASYRLKSVIDVDAATKWQGVGGDIDGKINPALNGTAGLPMEIRIENGDGATHNLLVRDPDGETVARSDDIGLNERAELTWTPEGAGAYSYECEYHSDTMTGDIDVKESE